jgi:hypothetical protein
LSLHLELQTFECSFFIILVADLFACPTRENTKCDLVFACLYMTDGPRPHVQLVHQVYPGFGARHAKTVVQVTIGVSIFFITVSEVTRRLRSGKLGYCQFPVQYTYVG